MRPKDSNPGPLLRRQLLYPAELRALTAGSCPRGTYCVGYYSNGEPGCQAFCKTFTNPAGFSREIHLIPFYKAVKRPQFRHSVGFPARWASSRAQSAPVSKALGYRAGELGLDQRVIFLLAQPVRQRHREPALRRVGQLGRQAAAAAARKAILPRRPVQRYRRGRPSATASTRRSRNGTRSSRLWAMLMRSALRRMSRGSQVCQSTHCTAVGSSRPRTASK